MFYLQVKADSRLIPICFGVYSKQANHWRALYYKLMEQNWRSNQLSSSFIDYTFAVITAVSNKLLAS